MTLIALKFAGRRGDDAIAVADIDLSDEQSIAAFRTAIPATGFRLAALYRDELRRRLPGRRVEVTTKIGGARIAITARGLSRMTVSEQGASEAVVIGRAPGVFANAYAAARTIQQEEPA